MNDAEPRAPSSLVDTLGLLRDAVDPGPDETIWNRLLRHVGGPRVRGARITRRSGERRLRLATIGEGDAETAPAEGADPLGGDGRATVELFERDRPASTLTVETHGPVTARDRQDLELFAAAASARLTDRSLLLETRLATTLASSFGFGQDLAAAAASALATLVPQLRAASGLLIETGATHTRVVATHGFPPDVERILLANRVPFAEGLVWKSCLDQAPRFARDYGNHPERLDTVVRFMAPVVLVHPLVHLGVARYALLLSFAPEHEPTAGARALIDGLAPVLAALLATSRDRERHDRLLAFQFRALTQQLDDLLQEVLDVTVETVPGAECGSLMVRDPSDGSFAYRALRGFDDEQMASVRFSEAEALAWYDPDGLSPIDGGPRILTSTTVDMLGHARATGASRRWTDVTEVSSIRANLCIPIVDDGQAIAFVNLDNRRWEGAFGPDSLLAIERYAPATAALLLGALRHERMQAQAFTDPLTGLLNRRGFERRFRSVLHDAERRKAPFTVMVMDLHGFKHLNDRLGHEAGDVALRRVAQALASQARKQDVLARWGGDEFVAILPDLAVHDAGRAIARLQAAVRSADPDGGVSVDIGASGYPDDDHDPTGLIQLADGRMYAGKRRRRGDPSP